MKFDLPAAVFVILITTNLLAGQIDARKRTEVIAHRGASGYLPEHTLEAKVAAYFMEADYLEQDVVLTKDFRPLVLHDIHLDEVTDVAVKFPGRNRSDSRYYAVDFTLAEIKTLDASERFDYNNTSKQIFPNRFPARKSSFQLNSLEEEIELVQGLEGSLTRLHNVYYGDARKVLRTGLHVEIKQPEFHQREGKGNVSEIVLAVLKKYNYVNKPDRAIIQCFDPKELKRIKEELKSNLRLVQLLYQDQESDGVKWTSAVGLKKIAEFADGIGPEKDMLIDYDPKTDSVTPSQMYKDAKSLKLFFHPYTFRVDLLPKYASTYQKLLKIFVDDLEVDGMFSDFPDVTLDYIRNVSSVLEISPIVFLASMFLRFMFEYLY
jgi:glycerophosphoryl diester phosphodiesterase